MLQFIISLYFYGEIDISMFLGSNFCEWKTSQRNEEII